MKFLAFFTGCAGTFALRWYGGASAVTASAAVGLAGTFIPSLGRVDRKHLHLVLYAGTFAGMGSFELLGGPGGLLAISLVGTGIYLLVSPHFHGLGGKLGVVAFVASLLLILARSAA